MRLLSGSGTVSSAKAALSNPMRQGQVVLIRSFLGVGVIKVPFLNTDISCTIEFPKILHLQKYGELAEVQGTSPLGQELVLAVKFWR